MPKHNKEKKGLKGEKTSPPRKLSSRKTRFSYHMKYKVKRRMLLTIIQLVLRPFLRAKTISQARPSQPRVRDIIAPDILLDRKWSKELKEEFRERALLRIDIIKGLVEQGLVGLIDSKGRKRDPTSANILKKDSRFCMSWMQIARALEMLKIRTRR